MIIERITDGSGNLLALVGWSTFEDSARYFRGLDAETQRHIRQSTDGAIMQVYGPLCDAYPNGCPILPESND